MHTKYTLRIIPIARAYVKLTSFAESKAGFLRHWLDLEIAALVGFVLGLDNAFEREPTSSFLKYIYSVHVQFRCLQRKNPNQNP